MKVSLVAVLFALCVVGCENASSKDSVQNEYDDFIKGYSLVSSDSANNLTLNDTIYVVRDDGSQYVWDYSASNGNVVFLDEKSFDFNDPEAVGGPIRKVWRFKCVTKGTVDLTFNYHLVYDATSISETKIYSINIQ